MTPKFKTELNLSPQRPIRVHTKPKYAGHMCKLEVRPYERFSGVVPNSILVALL